MPFGGDAGERPSRGRSGAPSPGSGHGKCTRAVAPAWTHVDYAKWTDAYFGDAGCVDASGAARASLVLTFGPWCLKQGDVTRESEVRATSWVRSLIVNGHGSAVMHASRLGVAMVMFLVRPSQEWRCGGGHRQATSRRCSRST